MELSEYKRKLTEIDERIDYHEKQLEILYGKRLHVESAFIPECENNEECSGDCEKCELWLNA